MDKEAEKEGASSSSVLLPPAPSVLSERLGPAREPAGTASDCHGSDSSHHLLFNE